VPDLDFAKQDGEVNGQDRDVRSGKSDEAIEAKRRRERERNGAVKAKRRAACKYAGSDRLADSAGARTLDKCGAQKLAGALR
jgi:hypothetical protein